MAKTKISQYDVVASNNTDIDGVNIAESCPPSGINNAIREVMAHLKDLQAGTSGDTIPVASGGTGSGTASGARTNLGLGTVSTLNSIATANIDADAVTNAKIADDSIDSEHYVDGSIDTAHIADSQITSAKIANNNVTADELNVSGNGTSGQTLVSDGDGSFSWGDGGITKTSGSAPYYGIRAWANFDGTDYDGSGNCTIRSSGNIASIVRTDTGRFTVTLTNAMPDTNYAVIGIGTELATANPGSNATLNHYATNSTTVFLMQISDASGNTYDDPVISSFAVIG